MLKGGAGNDIFSFTAANLTNTDTISGGGGSNELLMTTAGAVTAAGVVGVETYVLADGGANTLTLVSGNFSGVTGSTITVSDGNGGNAGQRRGGRRPRPPDRLCRHWRRCLDRRRRHRMSFTPAATPGSTSPSCRAPTRSTISPTGTNEIAFQQCGLQRCGPSGASATPTLLPASLFVSDATGAFTNTTERFAYGATNGDAVLFQRRVPAAPRISSPA